MQAQYNGERGANRCLLVSWNRGDLIDRNFGDYYRQESQQGIR